ncbi:MAG TPA: hypothetical protein VF070_45435 [Streptosporangiaceae bacterium]
MRNKLRREPGPGCGPLEVLLVGAADDELVLATLEQVPVRCGAMSGDMLVDRLADIGGQRDVAELASRAVLQRPQLRCGVDLLLDPQGLAMMSLAAQADREGLADPQSAAVHQPYRGGPVRRQPGGDSLDLRGGGDDEVGRGSRAG